MQSQLDISERIHKTGIDDLLSAADKKLFQQISNEMHCLHLHHPKRKNNKILNSLRIRGHNIFSHKLKQHYSKTVSSTGVYFPIFSVLRVLPVLWSAHTRPDNVDTGRVFSQSN